MLVDHIMAEAEEQLLALFSDLDTAIANENFQRVILVADQSMRSFVHACVYLCLHVTLCLCMYPCMHLSVLLVSPYIFSFACILRM